MSNTNTSHSFALLGRIATKLMDTYKEIKQLCDQGGLSNIDHPSNQQNTQNQISSNLQKTQKSDMKKVSSTTENNKQSSLNSSQSQKNPPPVPPPSNLNPTQTKQKIGSNLSRIQQKMKSLPGTVDKNKKSNTPNSNPTGISSNNTSYLLYFQERQPELATKNPSMSITSMCQKINQQWQNMDPAKKQHYSRKVMQNTANNNNNSNGKGGKNEQDTKMKGIIKSDNIKQKGQDNKGSKKGGKGVGKKSKKHQDQQEEEYVSDFDFMSGGGSEENEEILQGIYQNDQGDESQ